MACNACMTYRLAGTTGQKIPLQHDNNQVKMLNPDYRKNNGQEPVGLRGS